MIILYIILIILAILLLLCLLPVRLVFLINSDGTKIDLGYMFFRFSLYPTPKKTHKTQNTSQSQSEEKKKDGNNQFLILKELYGEIIKTVKKLLHCIFRHALTIEELNISAKLGTADPADTGIICGSAYAAIFQVLGFLKHNMKLKKFSVDISPDFDDCIVSGGVYAILRTRIAYAFVILYIILPLIIKYKQLSRRINK